MDSFTLSPAQRARLLAAAALRAKQARLEHYRRQAELAATPDYFQWAEHAQRFMADLCEQCAEWRVAARLHCVLRGADPYNDQRGMAA